MRIIYENYFCKSISIFGCLCYIRDEDLFPPGTFNKSFVVPHFIENITVIKM